MTLEPPTLLDLSTDTLCVLFKLATRPPESLLRKQHVENLLGMLGQGIKPTMQPLVDRQWVTGCVTKGYQLTPSGTQAVRSLVAFANQTLA